MKSRDKRNINFVLNSLSFQEVALPVEESSRVNEQG